MIDKKISNSKELSRALLYQFLALAFYEPSQALIEDFKREENIAQLMEVGKTFLGEKNQTSMTEVLEAIVGVNDKDTFTDLKVEYTRLFIGPMTPACPPYESVFDKTRSREWQGTMAGPSTDAMDEALRAEGLEITLEYAELSDHIAIELEFMYYLLSKACFEDDDARSYLDKANAFLVNHLAKWLPEFGQRVSEKSTHPFYQKLGVLLQAVIEVDLKELNN